MWHKSIMSDKDFSIVVKWQPSDDSAQIIYQQFLAKSFLFVYKSPKYLTQLYGNQHQFWIELNHMWCS